MGWLFAVEQIEIVQVSPKVTPLDEFDLRIRTPRKRREAAFFEGRCQWSLKRCFHEGEEGQRYVIGWPSTGAGFPSKAARFLTAPSQRKIDNVH
jgi:hypothetical protein